MQVRLFDMPQYAYEAESSHLPASSFTKATSPHYSDQVLTASSVFQGHTIWSPIIHNSFGLLSLRFKTELYGYTFTHAQLTSQSSTHHWVWSSYQTIVCQ